MIEKMKVVHIVTTAAEKTALLDRLQQLGIVHFSEKAGSAASPALCRSVPDGHCAAGVWQCSTGEGPSVQ